MYADDLDRRLRFSTNTNRYRSVEGSFPSRDCPLKLKASCHPEPQSAAHKPCPVVHRLPSQDVGGRLARRHPELRRQVEAVLHMPMDRWHDVAVDRVFANIPAEPVHRRDHEILKSCLIRRAVRKRAGNTRCRHSIEPQ